MDQSCCCCCETPAYEADTYFDDEIIYVDDWGFTEPIWTDPISVEQTYVELPPVEAPVVEPVLTEPIYVELPPVEAPVVEPVLTEPTYVEPVAVPAPNVAFVGGIDPTGGITVIEPTPSNVSTPTTNTAVIGGQSLGSLDGPVPDLDIFDQILAAGRTAADNGLNTAANGVIGTLGAQAIGRTGVSTSNYGTNMTTMGTGD